MHIKHPDPKVKPSSIIGVMSLLRWLLDRYRRYRDRERRWDYPSHAFIQALIADMTLPRDNVVPFRKPASRV